MESSDVVSIRPRPHTEQIPRMTTPSESDSTPTLSPEEQKAIAQRAYWRKYRKQWREKHRHDELGEKDRKKKAECQKRWHETHKEESAKRSKESARKNPDARRAANKRYRETHAEQIKSYQQRTRDMERVRRERYMAKNRERQKQYWKEYNEKNRDKKRDRYRQRHYGITNKQWEELFEVQGKKCAICGTTEPGGRTGWHGDHDHATNKFRGILCNVCNVMLGHARDDLQILARAAEYLKNPPYSQSLPK